LQWQKACRITLPDDWHVHLRDGELLNAVAPFSENAFWSCTGNAQSLPASLDH